MSSNSKQHNLQTTVKQLKGRQQFICVFWGMAGCWFGTGPFSKLIWVAPVPTAHFTSLHILQLLYMSCHSRLPHAIPKTIHIKTNKSCPAPIWPPGGTRVFFLPNIKCGTGISHTSSAVMASTAATRTAAGAAKVVKPIFSRDLDEAKRRVRELYRAWYREVPNTGISVRCGG